MSVIKKFVEYFNVYIDYLMGNDLYVIKEIGKSYRLYNDEKFIDAKEIFNLMKRLAEEGTIEINKKVINKEQKRILSNGLDVILGLMVKESN